MRMPRCQKPGAEQRRNKSEGHVRALHTILATTEAASDAQGEKILTLPVGPG